MIEVQEPPDVPLWVVVLDDAYQRLCESILKADAEFEGVKGDCRKQGILIHSLEGDFPKDTTFKNAHQFAAAVFTKLGEELALKGIKVEIPSNDLPDSILPAQFQQARDYRSFRPLKLYQYLFEKYAGRNAHKLVQSHAAKAFVRHFGHHSWDYVGAVEPDRARRPILDNFIAKSFTEAKNGYVGHLTTYQGDSFRAAAGRIDWKYDSSNGVKLALYDLADLLQLADRNQGLIDFVRLTGDLVAAKTRGKDDDITYGQRCIHQDPDSGEMLVIFRKEKLEIRFSTALLDIIRSFLITHHPDFTTTITVVSKGA
jgi:hypothetical protein